jgi:pimeloyl-ACP methyl ester carboxylesterase
VCRAGSEPVHTTVRGGEGRGCCRLSIRLPARAARGSSLPAAAARREAIGKYYAPAESVLDYLKDIRQPTLVVQGSNDVIVLTVNSYIRGSATSRSPACSAQWGQAATAGRPTSGSSLTGAMVSNVM